MRAEVFGCSRTRSVSVTTAVMGERVGVRDARGVNVGNGVRVPRGVRVGVAFGVGVGEGEHAAMRVRRTSIKKTKPVISEITGFVFFDAGMIQKKLTRAVHAIVNGSRENVETNCYGAIASLAYTHRSG